MDDSGRGAVAAGVIATAQLLSSMVAEPVGSTSLRGTLLAQELSKAASEAGGEVFQQTTGFSPEAQALVVALSTDLATKAIGRMCAKRQKPAEPAAASGQAEGD